MVSSILDDVYESRSTPKYFVLMLIRSLPRENPPTPSRARQEETVMEEELRLVKYA
jgi:hypothetical protein